MRAKKESAAKRIHPYAWLWEGLEADPTFVLSSMFGTKAVYLDGKLMLCLSAREEPWHGVLVCTAREHHPSLLTQFPALAPHPILPKWLYLSDSAEGFDRVAEQLVALARSHDPRVGVAHRARKAKRTHSTL